MDNEDKSAKAKAMIHENALRGGFDNSPLVSTVHSITCPNCKNKQNLVLLEYLKTGRFEIGNAECFEALITEGIINLLEKEIWTPIVVRPICKQCGCTFELKMINIEYLKAIIERSQASKTMYA